MALVLTNSGKRFESADGETLLDAALRAGVTLSYSCRTGRCSSCKAQLLSGTTQALRDETGLSPADLAAGWVLSCVRSAVSDVELAVEDLGDVQLFAPKTLPCRIQSLEIIGPDVLAVQLRLPPTSVFSFHPGQYIEVIGPGGMRRSYSVANVPADHGPLELHIKRVPDGAMSSYWFQEAKVNDLLRLQGPLGTFFLRDIEDRDLVFLATGTGIAPVKAMLEGLARPDDRKPCQPPRSITVFWGARTPEDLYWAVQVAGSAHRFVPVLSRAEAPWDGQRGYVQQALLAEGRDWSRTTVYACGSDAMIHSARTDLLSAGLSERCFHSDAFVSSAPA